MVTQQAPTLWRRYLTGSYAWAKYRYEANVWYKLLFAFGMACFTGLVAQVRIPLPWTPVPITGQTFAVLLAGVILGRWWGGISQAMYAAFGFAGMPWFAGWSGGIDVLLGPTGGYIIGFILAALFLGYFTDTFINSRKFFPMLGLMLVANFLLIQGPGLLQLNLWVSLGKGKPFESLHALLMAGTIPFIPGDIIKAVAAALVANALRR